jgi:hypothetical protein
MIFQKNPSKKRQENDSDPSAELGGAADPHKINRDTRSIALRKKEDF